MNVAKKRGLGDGTAPKNRPFARSFCSVPKIASTTALSAVKISRLRSARRRRTISARLNAGKYNALKSHSRRSEVATWAVLGSAGWVAPVAARYDCPEKNFSVKLGFKQLSATSKLNPATGHSQCSVRLSSSSLGARVQK